MLNNQLKNLSSINVFLLIFLRIKKCMIVSVIFCKTNAIKNANTMFLVAMWKMITQFVK